MMTESSFVQPAVPRFDGHYDHWAMLIENFLYSKEYWGLREWNSCSSIRCCSHRCLEKEHQRSNAKRFKGQKLSISSIRSFNPRNDS